MKITDKFISIPPYLSVSWKEVAHLKSENGDVKITLKTGESVSIPNLSEEIKNELFRCHTQFLEIEDREKIANFPPMNVPFGSGIPIGFKIGTPDGNVISAFQHNPAQAESPPLPVEILEKIVESTEAITGDEIKVLPLGEKGCNCFFCQIMNAIHGHAHVLEIEEIVDDKELTFKDWIIQQTGDKLYSVTDPSSPDQKFSVYLGHPVGCTCGIEGCEHIVAVLKT